MSNKLIKPITYPRSFTSNKYPEFIRESVFLKAFPKPEKVFPRIGLKNCEMPLKSVKIDSKELMYAKLNDIVTDIRNRKITIEYTLGYSSDIAIDINRLLTMLNRHLDNNEADNIVRKVDGKYDVFAPLNLDLKTFPTSKDTKLIDVLNHFSANEAIKTLNSILKIRSMNGSDLVKKKKLKVCFSSSGNKGYWDIATMSMRKINSCMRWSSSHAKSLVGSILDPYAGIVYITDNANTKYGKSMLARAVVRLVVGYGSNKPSVLVESVYTSNERSYDPDKVEKIFKSFIESKVKIPVITADNSGSYDFTIPFSEATKAIEETQGYDNEHSYLSYRDSDIEYDDVKKFFNPRMVRI